MVVVVGYCVGFVGLQLLVMFELVVVVFCCVCVGNGDVGDCCLVVVGCGCGNYFWVR